MAIVATPVNNFRTITKVVELSASNIYETPVGYDTVVLLAQCANTSSQTQTISFYHNRVETGIGTVSTEIVSNYPVPANDTVSLISGRMVLETGDYVSIIGSNATDLKFLLSVLETSNQ